MGKMKPGPKPKPPRNDVTAKIDADALRAAKLVATYRNQTLAEYLSELVSKHANEEWEKIRQNSL